MSKESNLPPDLVEASLDHLIVFANTMIPYLKAACAHAKSNITNVPPGGLRSPDAERQLFPAFVRCAMHQLIEGHNFRASKDGTPLLRRKHIRNGAVCLAVRDTDYRLLKSSKRHPTRPSGFYQEALIEQKQYWDLIHHQSPLIRMDRVLLNGLIYYQVRDMELLEAHVVIPGGFNSNGGVVQEGMRQVPVDAAYEELASFDPGGGNIGILDQPSGLVLGDGTLPDMGVGMDPYEDALLEEIYEKELIDDANGVFQDEALRDSDKREDL